MNFINDTLSQWIQFLKVSLGTTTALSFRYLLFAGVAWILGYHLFKRKWMHRKIIPSYPASRHWQREMTYSFLSLFLFGIVGAITIVASRKGWTQMYWKIEAYGWTWFFLSIVLAIFVHDTYFYWSHRLLHSNRFLFKHIHRIHHLSHNPTPWASYAFSPYEALIQAAIFPILTLLFPLHPIAFMIFMTWQITFNVIGHTGYEHNPSWFLKSWLGYLLNTPTNHTLHHEKGVENYGLYFNLWDRWMKTNHRDYETRFHQVTTRTVSCDAMPQTDRRCATGRVKINEQA